MSKYWWTSDIHVKHKSILHYTDRHEELKIKITETDDRAMELHDHWIRDTINATVGEKDYLFFLGDIYLGANKWQAAHWLSQIECRHKVLIGGNHDRKLMDFYRTTDLFEEIHEHRHEIRVNGRSIIMDHHPIAEWDRGHHGVWHLHGHTHGNFDYKAANLHDKKILDVGWDNAIKVLGQYRPFEFADIEKFMADKVNITHHNKAG